MFARPAAVIFDMDGLLLDSEPVWHEAEWALARVWGAHWTEADAAGCTGTGIPETARRLSAAANRPFDPLSDLDTLIEGFLALAPRVQAKTGARDLIDYLTQASIPLALGSSSPRRVIDLLLLATDFRAAFSVIVSGSDVARLKPEPDIFLDCARALRVQPSNCLVLEDSLAGVEAGKRAGMTVFGVPELPRPEIDALADQVFADLGEVQSFLRAGISRGG